MDINIITKKSCNDVLKEIIYINVSLIVEKKISKKIKAKMQKPLNIYLLGIEIIHHMSNKSSSINTIKFHNGSHKKQNY